MHLNMHYLKKVYVNLQSNVMNKKIEKLNNPTTEALTYLGYYYPKTQAQLVDLVYNFPQTREKLSFPLFRYQIPSTPIMPPDPCENVW